MGAIFFQTTPTCIVLDKFLINFYICCTRVVCLPSANQTWTLIFFLWSYTFVGKNNLHNVGKRNIKTHQKIEKYRKKNNATTYKDIRIRVRANASILQFHGTRAAYGEKRLAGLLMGRKGLDRAHAVLWSCSLFYPMMLPLSLSVQDLANLAPLFYID